MSDLLRLEGVHAGYGAGLVLHGVDLTVGRDEAVALFGRNGMGKTTLVHAVMGLVRVQRGVVRHEGEDVTNAPSHVLSRRGVALVPQGRRVFATLSVEENLRIAARPGPWTVERVWDFFPQLHARRALRGTTLSGGEQQMLAIGRALVQNPRLMLLDEPSEGLAPRVVDEIGEVLLQVKHAGIPCLLVEQSPDAALRVADRVYVLESGKVAFEGTADRFSGDPELARTLLGVTFS